MPRPNHGSSKRDLPGDPRQAMSYLWCLILTQSTVCVLAGCTDAATSTQRQSDENSQQEQVSHRTEPGDSTTYDFGVVRPGDVKAYTFRLPNTTSSVWEINAIRAECSCTVAEPSSTVVNPGETLSLETQLKVPDGLGDIAKRVTIELKGRTYINCQIKAQVRPEFVVQPNYLLIDPLKDTDSRITVLNFSTPHTGELTLSCSDPRFETSAEVVESGISGCVQAWNVRIRSPQSMHGKQPPSATLEISTDETRTATVPIIVSAPREVVCNKSIVIFESLGVDAPSEERFRLTFTHGVPDGEFRVRGSSFAGTENSAGVTGLTGRVVRSEEANSLEVVCTLKSNDADIHEQKRGLIQVLHASDEGSKGKVISQIPCIVRAKT